ncbi:MAG: hypothetical protein VX741_06880, partial [Pseudomonadota bacterium]|nr:hypothetical protein [Pseudomonadota bacterium]
MVIVGLPAKRFGSVMVTDQTSFPSRIIGIRNCDVRLTGQSSRIFYKYNLNTNKIKIKLILLILPKNLNHFVD